ncbi:ADP-ribosylation factor-binding protein GGA [Fasciola gigantica]|uniref:ADP-ribosylation factor-binding protein GGA n=1 Tax=Fasciola gigantica TaxID=46835 RepID=A0A504Z4K5_FASGI|nr:ADP-ribosylation factor-binding protein GGA [Fasciola gigantica]
MGDASRRTDIFDRNRHSERLTKLLRSRNPNDIAEANRIIKSIVEEDQQRMEKETRRTTEMESLKNNTLLLNEMTANYIRSGASEAELELMSELVDNIGKARPLLYSFSLTHDENDIMTLTEIARICEQATSALEFYAEKVTKSAAHETPSVTNISGPDSPGLDLGNLAPESRTITPDNQTAGVDDLLSRDLFELGLSDVGPAVGAVPQPLVDLNPTTKPAPHTRYDELEDIFSKLVDKTPVSASTNQISPIKATSVPGVTKTPSHLVSQPCYHSSAFLSSSSADPVSDSPTKTQLFDELDALGRQMLGFDT